MKLNNPSDVYEAAGRYRAKRQEYFIVLTLNGAHEPIRFHTVTIGIVNRTLVHAREVFYKAIKDNAAAILILHNHPSGNVEPSSEDEDITERLSKAGEILGIPVLDHLVISKKGYYSFVEHGKMDSQTRI